MRTTNKTMEYLCKQHEPDWFKDWNSGEKLCASVVRAAFDIGRAKKVTFHVTNSKPKRLTNWHILKKNKDGIWKITLVDTEFCPELLYGAGNVVTHDFPNNTTLYVCAY